MNRSIVLLVVPLLLALATPTQADDKRIEFILGSPALAERVTGAMIDRDERAGAGASDHAPVIVELA